VFHDRTVQNHNSCNSELPQHLVSNNSTNCGAFIRARFQEAGFPSARYEVQIHK